jgi:manganese efflux pump family protein
MQGCHGRARTAVNASSALPDAPGAAPVTGLLLVAFSLGLSNFAAAIGIGVGGVSRRGRLRVGVLFAVFEAGMPLVGLLAGHAAARAVSSSGRPVGGVLLAITGLYTIVQARRGGAITDPTIQLVPLIMTSAALSIDNLVAGFALGLGQVAVATATLVIGVVSVAMAIIGLELGARLGVLVERRSGELAGCVLVAVGAALAGGLIG